MDGLDSVLNSYSQNMQQPNACINENVSNNNLVISELQSLMEKDLLSKSKDFLCSALTTVLNVADLDIKVLLIDLNSNFNTKILNLCSNVNKLQTAVGTLELNYNMLVQEFNTFKLSS